MIDVSGRVPPRRGLVLAGESPEELLGERVDLSRVARRSTEQMQAQSGLAESADVARVESGIGLRIAT
jgi:hypothetical protein